jgi:hypothetical protein
MDNFVKVSIEWDIGRYTVSEVAQGEGMVTVIKLPDSDTTTTIICGNLSTMGVIGLIHGLDKAKEVLVEHLLKEQEVTYGLS